VKLVFYSGGQQPANNELHQALMDLTGKRRGISLTYVPFCSDNSDVFYRRAARRYQRFGATRFQCLAVDLPKGPTEDEVKRALSSDVVYLAGGNTFYFLSWLRKRKLLGALRDYVRDGGVLAGLSAGAHIITPHIALAGLKGLDPDDNEVGLKTFNALGLVGFEFMPHFYANRRSLKILRKYSAQSGTSVYACADGGGIVIDGSRFMVHGKTWIFHGGDWLRLN
jgi:dipeptidase E